MRTVPAHRRLASAAAARLLVTALALLLCLCTSTAAAQRAALALSGSASRATSADAPGTQPALSLTAALSGWRGPGFDADAWLLADVRAGQTDRPAGLPADLPANLSVRLGAGTALRYASTFGPLGTAVLEAGGAVIGPGASDAALLARAWLGGRGTLGGVALALAVEAGNAASHEIAPGRPPPPDVAGREAVRDLDALRAVADAAPGTWDAGARLSAVYRLDRDVRLSLDGAARSVAGDAHVSGQLALRRARLATDVDGWLGLDTLRYRGETSLAVGVGVFHVPRRGPTSWLRLWLGSGAEGIRPGVEMLALRRLAAGELRLQASWRPWLAPQAWSAEIGFDHPLDEATLRFTLGAAGAAGGATRLQAGIRWERPLPSVR